MRNFAFLILLLFAFPAFAQETPPQKNPNSYDNVPDEYFEEADQFIDYCESLPNMNQYYNCECLGYEYLNQRLKDPKADRSAIMLAINKTCADATGAAGVEYERCMGNAPMLPLKLTPEDYCQCFANTYAKLFERAGTGVTSKAIVELQTEAHISCADPLLAKKLYPYVPPVK